MKNLPKKQEIAKYNPETAKLAKENLLRHIENYPKNLTEKNIEAYILDGRDYLKVYQNATLSIKQANQKRLDIEKKLKDKLIEAKKEFDKIAQLKANANSQISFFAKSCEAGKEFETWNKYFEKYGKYTTYSYSDFEKLCNQYQIQKAKEKEIEKLSKFEQLLNEPKKVESVQVQDVESIKYNTKVIVDFDKLDCRKAINILLKKNKAEQLIEMLRIALKDTQQEIEGITYVKEVVANSIRR